jgi:hypothetical protein
MTIDEGVGHRMLLQQNIIQTIQTQSTKRK